MRKDSGSPWCTMLTCVSAARDQWLPSWGEGNNRGMTVKNVKMWREGKC